ncbi:Serine/threonine-protein kinase ATM [Hordeum vulgare]|nr:Serine/threonine-protein kinase ATM [Hordeum vulgare]
MKRNGDIKSFFQNYEAKTRKVAAQEQHEPDIDPPPLPPLHSDSEIDTDIYSPPVHSDLEIDIDIDDEAPRQPSPQHPNARSYNIQRLPTDPGERIPISEYDVGDQDEVRRRYIAKNAVQPYAQNFEVKKMYGKNRHFNFVWFENYKWLEYSVKYEAAFCFVCYLFKGKSNGGPRGDAFVKGGWKIWYRPDALDKHEGGINSIHSKA